MKKTDRKLKRIENEIIGLTMEIVGCVWGIEAGRRSWLDNDMKIFNNFVADRRNAYLKKIEKIYLRKVKDYES